MDDRMIIALLKNDPEKGIHEAILKYGRAVRKICAVMLSSLGQEVREETEQDVFVKLWKVRTELNSDVSLKKYLYAITRNAAIDVLRRQKQEIPVEMDFFNEFADEMNITAKIENDMRIELLSWLLEKLGSPDKEIFYCRYFLNMRVKEIAELLGINEKKVENVLFRDKDKLKKILRERGIQSYDEI